MKKAILLFLTAALACGLIACSGGNTDKSAGNHGDSASSHPVEYATVDPSTIRSSFEKGTKLVENSFDVKSMTVQTQDDDGGAALYQYWSPKEETDADSLSKEIELDGHKLTLGETIIGELEDYDWKLEKSSDTEQPNEVIAITLNKDGKYCAVQPKPNDTDQALSIADLPLSAVITAVKEFSLPYTYSGITAQSTLKDVLDALGTPNKMITLCSDDTGVSLELNYGTTKRDGNQVTDFTVTIYLTCDTENNTAAVSNLSLSQETYTAEESK